MLLKKKKKLRWGSSASVRSIPFLSFIELIFAWNVPLVSLIFLKRSLLFPILLFSSISLHWSLRKAFLSPLAVLWNSAFKWEYLSFSPLPFASLLFTAICKASSDNHSAFLYFFSLEMVLGEKVVNNLDSILKSRDIILPTKVCLVKAMVFPYSCVDVRVGL